MTARRILLIALASIALRLGAQETAAQSEEFKKAMYFAKSFFEMSQFADAYEYFVRADAIQPDQPTVLYDMALVLAKTGRYSEAQVKVDRYKQLYPAGAERSLVDQLQLKLEFQRELQRKRQENQEYTDLFTKGRFLYGKNDLDAALKLFQEAEQRRASEPAALYDQGLVYEKLGDFARAAERYRRYLELETDSEQKGTLDQHIVNLEGELEEMGTKLVCSFCGHRIERGATWCHRCWHGPYTTAPASAQACVPGSSATRALFFAGDRFFRNETLSCVVGGPIGEALRYSPSRQRSIQDARKAEGWIFNGEIIQGWRGRDGEEIRYAQGAEYLERIDSPATGEILTFSAHKLGTQWALDREETLIDGQKFVSRYTFDGNGHIQQQEVEFQNASGCNHLVSMTADFTWQGDRMTAATIRGGYDGFVTEGSPRTDWQVNVVNAFDDAGRIAKEDLVVATFTKTYAAKPQGPERDVVNTLYPSMRVRKPMTDMIRTGDLCGVSNGRTLSNAIDLRPFMVAMPDLAMALPNGVAHVTVTHVYAAQ